MSIAMPSPKRHMGEDIWPTDSYMIPRLMHLNSPVAIQPEDDAWREVDWSLFATDSLQPENIATEPFDGTLIQPNSRKRAYDDFETVELSDENALFQFSTQLPNGSDDWELQLNMMPSQPFGNFVSLVGRESNPFEEVAVCRHQTLKSPIKLGDVNSYVKLRLTIENEQNLKKKEQFVKKTADQKPLFLSRRRLFHAEHVDPSKMNSTIPGIPAGMGRSIPFDATDSKLFKFYQMAMCSGRTLLPSTNGWLNDLAPMAENDDMMRHAILAFAAGYVLDLRPSEELRERANSHYRRASGLLTANLNSINAIKAGQEDAVVACIRVMWCDDIVQWEMRRTPNKIPRWWKAVQLGKRIMAKTDQSFRYYSNTTNVQCSSARISNGNNMAMVHLIGNMTLPLSVRETEEENLHPWLLEGTEQESRRIFGGTGMCPKLLHMIGQISHLSARMNANETSTIIPLGAKSLAQKLINFHQWSELSAGPSSTEVLLQSCILKDGLVDTAREVTELSGEAWVQTARIYLQIRFFRLPRNHREVQQPFRLLCRIIEKLPPSGPLFTAQTPFFPVFLLGLIASKPEDRQIARTWFETVASKSGVRSNVPPIWQVLQRTWGWIDTEMIEDDDEDIDQKPICDRLAWWESLVERWYTREGYLSIV